MGISQTPSPWTIGRIAQVIGSSYTEPQPPISAFALRSCPAPVRPSASDADPGPRRIYPPFLPGPISARARQDRVFHLLRARPSSCLDSCASRRGATPGFASVRVESRPSPRPGFGEPKRGLNTGEGARVEGPGHKACIYMLWLELGFLNNSNIPTSKAFLHVLPRDASNSSESFIFVESPSQALGLWIWWNGMASRSTCPGRPKARENLNI